MKKFVIIPVLAKKQTERLFVQCSTGHSQVIQNVFKMPKSLSFSLPSCLSDGILGRIDEYIFVIKKLIIVPKLVMI